MCAFPTSRPFTGLLAVAAVLSGCAASGGAGEADWPPLGKKWFDRAETSFKQGDVEDARVAIDHAMKVVPERDAARLLAAKIALAELDYDRAVTALKGLDTSEARGVRGRAFWYAGEVDHAADELEKLVTDPEVRDPWAADIAKLARLGAGRKPFDVSGGLVAAVEMPRTGTTSLIVPLELNGEPVLGLVSTGVAEAVIDSSAGAKASWVSLRFGERIEVRDVPALAQDLTGLSRQLNAPIRILLGVNVLRHLRPTFDIAGAQFVVRTFDPPPPPLATTLKISYLRGGGMLLRGSFGAAQAAPSCSLLLDTSRPYPLSLDAEAWKKAGVDAKQLVPVQGTNELKQGLLPLLRLGAFELPQVPGLAGDTSVKEREDVLGVDLDGLAGSGLFAMFRVTLADSGRTMWLEDLPAEALQPMPALAPAPEPPYSGEGLEEEEEEPEAPVKGGKPAAKKPAAPAPAPGAVKSAPAAKPSAPATPAAAKPPAGGGGRP